MTGLTFTPTSLTITENYDYLKYRLERLFFMSYGDVIGYPGIGSRIPDYFWEPADEITATNILIEVKRLLSTYEPNIILLLAGVRLEPLITNEIMLVIEITITFLDSPFTEQDLIISRVREN